MDQSTHDDDTKEELILIGTAETLRRAMQATKLSEMMNCFQDLKSFSGTIERDLPNYFRHRSLHPTIELTRSSEETTTDFIQVVKESASNQYILLRDLIEQQKRINTIPTLKKNSSQTKYRSSSLEKQVNMMKHVIAAQPSALEGIYLEALLNPEQWLANHQRLQTSPQEILTLKERQRLKELLNQSK